MNRTIKFRAWDVENEQMYFSDNPTGTDEQIWTIGDMGQPVCLVLTTSLKSMGDNVEEAEDYVPVEQILMQFTGLTDKNGKDIYEGDICMFDMMDRTGLAGEVRYCDSGMGYWFDLKKGAATLNAISNIEIIGNIHDNPELLK